MSGSHQSESHEDALQAHRDAVRSNPFTLTNWLLGIGLIVGSSASLMLLSTVKETHETVLVHGVVLDGIKQDLHELKSSDKDTIKRQEFDHFKTSIAERIGEYDGEVSPRKRVQ